MQTRGYHGEIRREVELHPVLIEIGGTPIIHTFGVMVLLGVMLGLFVIKRDAPRVGLDPEELVSLSVEVFLAGLIGSRMFFVFHNWDMYSAPEVEWWQPFNIRSGGLVWYGGMLAGLPVAFWRAKAYRMPLLKVCDVLAGPVILGLAIGRIGCLMAGDDHGRIAEEATWYTLTFTDPKALMDPDYLGKPLLPSQPLMFLGCMIVFGILHALRRPLQHKPGAVAALLFVLYPIHRFLIEFTRGDKVRGRLAEDVPLLGGMSTSQAISVPMVILGLIVFAYMLWRPVSPEELAAPAPKPESEPDADSGPTPPATSSASPTPPATTPADATPLDEPKA